MKADFKKRLKEEVAGIVSFNSPTRDFTTFKIGGSAVIWVEPDSIEDLRRALVLLRKEGIEPLVLGGGSNLLIFDGKVNRAVIKLSASCFKDLRFSGRLTACGGGYRLSLFVKRCIEKGLSGPERLAGIPGTVGGAVMMNAGTRDMGICNLLESIDVIDFYGKEDTIKKKDLRFNYRDSGLSSCVITKAVFKLTQGDPEQLRSEFGRIYKKKVTSQEYGRPNAGCVFRNPRDSALTSGQMLDQCGLKGRAVGGAAFSTKHANFIINNGNARFNDVMSLIKMGQDSVREKFKVHLQPEIRIIYGGDTSPSYRENA